MCENKIVLCFILFRIFRTFWAFLKFFFQFYSLRGFFFNFSCFWKKMDQNAKTLGKSRKFQKNPKRPKDSKKNQSRNIGIAVKTRGNSKNSKNLPEIIYGRLGRSLPEAWGSRRRPKLIFLFEFLEFPCVFVWKCPKMPKH